MTESYGINVGKYGYRSSHGSVMASGSGAVILGLAPELPEWRNACDRVVLACQKFLEFDKNTAFLVQLKC